MYIEPNTNIRVLKDVPLDKTYEHTLYFVTKDTQTNYFAGQTKHNLANQSFQRVKRGYARIGLNIGELYDCNYLMFQNTSFAGKWFYAFITSVEYINNSVTEISFEIDDIQTWYFDYTFRDSFVAREHSVTDVVGEHILPEPVDISDYIINNVDIYDLGELYPVVCRAFDDDDDLFVRKYNNVYNGTKYETIKSDNLEEISDYFRELTDAQRTDSVVSIHLVPRMMLGNVAEVPDSYIPEFGEKQIGLSDNIDGYIPKNKKLFTYPYNFIQISDNSGNTMDYRYEYFDNPYEAKFKCAATVINEPECAVLPYKYNGTNGYNWDEIYLIDGFPQLSFTCDTYRAWIASGGRFANRINTVNRIVSSPSQIASGGLDAFTGWFESNPKQEIGGIAKTIGGVTNIATSVASAIKTGKVMEAMGNTVKGSSSSTLIICANRKNIYYINKCVRKEYAKYIDEFFSKYGYTCNRLKHPNISSRPHWNYVQTINATIEGSMPADAEAHICAIFDRGITFWKNADEVGHYELDNSPAGIM